MSEQNEIVIVSGLPRSGTSLMMQMLSLGGIEPLTDAIREADTDNPKGYYEFETVKKIKTDKAWLVDARGKVVKMISMLLYDLPPTELYKVIFMRRDLDEVIVSQEKMLARRGAAIPDRVAIKTAFATHLDKLFEWLPSQPSIQMQEINYSELIANPQPQVEQIAAFVSHPVSVDQMLSAVDPSLYRNRDIAIPS